MLTIVFIETPSTRPQRVRPGDYVIVVDHGRVLNTPRFWTGEGEAAVGNVDIFGSPITDEFVHGRVRPKTVKYPQGHRVEGDWIYRGIMSPENFATHGLSLRRDKGDRFRRTKEGWLLVS
jgi:hypothetical protein